MIARNCTREDLHGALAAINQRYAGNVTFRDIEQAGRRVRFTLRTKDSKAPGHTRGHGRPWDGKQGGRLPFACWHVHGHFFEELFKIAPEAGVYSSGSLANPVQGRWITKESGNWQDRNVGSIMFPRLASEACDCGPLKPVSESAGVKTFMMSQSMMRKCPLFIMVPEHYKADGTCLCFDRNEQEKKRIEKIKRRAMIDRILDRQKG